MTREHDIEIARSIVSAATPEQKGELLHWALELQDIREANLSRREKIIGSIRVTASRKVIFPILRSLSKNIKAVGKGTKRVLWDDRSIAGRFTIAGTLIATAGLSGQAAGIAALGRAIGVPLWFVVAGGSSLLGTIIQELSGPKNSSAATEYEIIEGQKKPGKEIT